MVQAVKRRLISPRVDLFPESVIREMTRLSDLNGAINLSQGFPDFPAPSAVKAAAAKAIRGDHNQYEVTWGSPELRDAIADKARSFNRIQASGEDNVTVTCGATEAMVATAVALTDASDDIIVPEPFYECYVPSTIISGARVRYVTLEEPWFSFDEEKLKRAFAASNGRRPKAIIVNTPNNPTGKVFSRGELHVVADLCEDYGVVAITDEIYEHITYDGTKHVSLATVGDMADKTVTISALSKTYSVTGWRLGYAIADKALTAAIRTVHDYLTVCAPTPLQRAALEALRLPGSYYSKLAKAYTWKRDFMLKSLEAIGFRCSKPQGAYYIMADFSEVWKGNDYSFAKHIVEDDGVASVPASSFYATKGHGKSQVRFAFPKQDSTLREAVGRMKERLS